MYIFVSAVVFFKFIFSFSFVFHAESIFILSFSVVEWRRLKVSLVLCIFWRLKGKMFERTSPIECYKLSVFHFSNLSIFSRIMVDVTSSCSDFSRNRMLCNLQHHQLSVGKNFIFFFFFSKFLSSSLFRAVNVATWHWLTERETSSYRVRTCFCQNKTKRKTWMRQWHIVRQVHITPLQV